MKRQFNQFNGFSKEALQFFIDLKENNNKDWFNERKEFYIHSVKEVSEDLVAECSQRFAVIGLPFTADVKKSLFRIYRDTRFSKNKDPFKTNMGVYFVYTPHADKFNDNSLGLYFHFDADECFLAGGIYMTPTPILRQIRMRMGEDWSTMQDIIENKNFKERYSGVFASESLKKVPLGFGEEHKGAKWLKMKDISFTSRLDFKAVQSADLIDIIIDRAVIIQPFLEYCYEAVE